MPVWALAVFVVVLVDVVSPGDSTVVVAGARVTGVVIVVGAALGGFVVVVGVAIVVVVAVVVGIILIVGAVVVGATVVAAVVVAVDDLSGLPIVKSHTPHAQDSRCTASSQEQ